MSNKISFDTRFSAQRALASLGLLFAFAVPSLALAGSSGGIAGVVTDASTGAPIPGVHLQISSPSQTINTTTDSRGHYIVFNLQPDNYTLTAVKTGYAAQSVSGDAVYADQTQQYDMTLTPAAPSS